MWPIPHYNCYTFPHSVALITSNEFQSHLIWTLCWAATAVSYVDNFLIPTMLGHHALSQQWCVDFKFTPVSLCHPTVLSIWEVALLSLTYLWHHILPTPPWGCPLNPAQVLTYHTSLLCRSLTLLGSEVFLFNNIALPHLVDSRLNFSKRRKGKRKKWKGNAMYG